MSEEKLMFGIGYDTSTAEKDAIKEVNATLKNIQSLLDKKPLKPTMTIPNSFRGQLASLTSEWNRLTAAERSSAKGQEIISKYRQLNKEVGIYSGTLRQAVNAEDKLQLSKEKGITLTKTQNSAYKTQLGYVERLALRWSAYGLIFGASRVLSNIRETTAEFELQRVALGAIIQDADRASKLFNQIKAAAIESPFEIKDLVRYTKELSAYRIETDQLFETTQRLADISAGLGVDMSRLVLAYGQVRAASVLRGQELRQFTESGIPLVQLLADKFSKLRGELVSTGEVFQLISERAVSFGMVKEIFDDMTNAGGMFYDMQRIQAKTIAGEWSNLKDAISIAYDEMGRELPFGEWIGSLKHLINNWRTVAQVVGTSVIAIASYSAAMKVVRFANDGAARSALALGRANILVTAAEKKKGATIANNSALLRRAIVTQDAYAIAITKSAIATNLFSKAWYKLKAAFLANWIGLVIAAISALVTWIISATQNANRLNNELAKIESKANIDFSRSTRNFERLAKAALSATDGSKKQTEALQELQRTYGDIIPAQNLTIEGLRNMKGNYDAVTQSIYEKIQAQKVESGLAAIQEEYTPKITEAEERFTKAIKGIKEFSNFSDSEISRIKAAYVQAINEGTINASMSSMEQLEKLFGIIEEQTGVNVDKTRGLFQKYNTESQEWIELNQRGYAILSKKEKDRYDSLESSLSKQQETFNALKYSTIGYITVVTNLNDAEDKLINSNKSYTKSLETLQKEVDNIGKNASRAEFQTDFEFNRSIAVKKIEAYRNFIEGQLQDKGISLSVEDLIKWSYADESKIPEDIKKQLAKISGTLKKDLDYALKQIGELSDSPQIELITKIFERVSNATGVSMDKLKQYMLSGEQSTKDWLDSLTKSLESAEGKLVETKGYFTLQEQEGFSVTRPFITKEDVENAEANANAIRMIIEAFKALIASKVESGSDKRTKAIQTEINLVQEVYKRYKEYLNYMSSAEAKSKIAKVYGDSIKNLKYGAAFDTKSMQDVLRKYQSKLSKLGKKDEAIKVGLQIDDLSFNSLKDNLTEELARLSDEISRSKTAKTFFDKMLGITGDRELAMSMTMSVYGDVGMDVGKKMMEQLTASLKGLKGIELSEFTKGENVDLAGLQKALSDMDILDSGMIENRKMALKFIQDMMQSRANEISDMFSTLQKYEDFETQKSRIMRQGEQERAAISKSFIPETKKKSLIEASSLSEKQAISKLEFDKFKEGDIWTMAFEDMERLSTNAMKNIIDKLDQFRESAGKDLSPKDLKEYMSAWKKLRDAIEGRNPFGAIKSGAKGIKDAKDSIRLIQSTIDSAKAIAQQGDDTESAAVATQLLVFWEKQLIIAQNGLSDSTTKATKGLNEIGKNGQDAINALSGLFDSLGVELDETTQKIFSGGDKMFQSLASIDLTKPASIITGTIGFIGGLFEATFGAAQVRKVAKANKEIERQQQILDNLEYAHKRLQKASEDALGVDYINNYNKRIEVLNAKVIAYQKQAEAERSKGKNEDKKKTREFLNNARAAQDEITDMYGTLSENMLGSSLASAAIEFSNAWLEAKLSFANTADAMSEKFEDMMQNMVVNSVMAKVVQQRLEDVFKMIDEMSTEDIYSDSFWKGLAEEMAKASTDVNKGLGVIWSYLESVGINFKKGTSNLTGVSKNIAGASEESINGLAAGINTQNFYIANINSNVASIRSLLEGGLSLSSQDLITMQNTYLSNLPSIKADTAGIWQEIKLLRSDQLRIADNLDRVIKPRGVQGSHTVNTSL